MTASDRPGRARALALLVVGLGPLLAQCGAPAPDGLLDVRVTHPDAPPIAPATECTVVTGREPASSRSHVDVCSPVDYPRHPPAGGPHYGAWADFGAYDAEIPWGFLVHSLEHGAVVLAYDCPAGCPEVIAAFERILTARAAEDALCRDHPAGARVIIVPDPTLETPIAAVAWEHVYTATCLDEPSLEAFVAAHYARAPEDLCYAGFAPPGGAWCP